MLRLSPRTFFAAVLGLVLMGCGQTKPDQKPTPPPNSGPTATSPGAKGDKPAETKTETTSKPAGETKPAPANSGATASVSAGFSEAAYLGDDVVGLVVANPRRVTDWDVYKLIKAEEGMLPAEAAMQLEQLPIAPEAIERVVVVFDQTFVNKAASSAGLEVKGGSNEPSPPIPTVIGTLANDTAAEGLLPVFGEEKDVDGVKLHVNEFPFETALWISDDKKTILVGPTSSVVKALATKKAGKASTSKVVSQINASADLSIAFALDSQAGLIEQGLQFAQGLPVGLIQQVHGLAFHINITGKPGSKMLEVVANAADEDAGKQMLEMLTPLLDNGKESAKSQLTGLAANGDETQKPALTIAEQIVDSAAIKQTGTSVAFSASIPPGFDKLPEILKPAIEQARKAAMGAKKKNNLKQIALGFHNYHDSNNGFPGAGKSAGGKAGLSWRVHLLPYIDQAPLYQQFNLDEPWDSETNKALIEQMPAIFKTEGVEEPGKTSVHVITGPGAPFAKDAAPKISAFLDGTSNTILAVEAGPDTAEIWTKPGGLDFDPKDPLKALGKLAGDTFLAMLCDGSVRSISIKIEAENLRRLFQLADGEVITDF